ncbi:vitamin B12 transporter [Pedobacter sp. CG_S7]|uniref:TonB-dependent receptor plug domain-containing protein n=1 Tax=Pedobacter sp. CG_S7 TaxID=3143930 RepID=UPI00339780CD
MEKLFFTTIFFLFSVYAFAQSDSSNTLKEVKVFTTPPPKVQSLQPSQQINASDFKRNGAHNLADAIRNFSGVNIKDYGGIGGLKTVSVRSLGANHTGVQFDGITISDTQNGQIDLGKINLDNIASITLYNGQPELILQPARAYASASMLVIKSLAPEFTEEKNYRLKLGLKTGSFGLFNPSLLYQQKINSNWSLNLSNTWQKAHGRYKYKVDGDGSDTLATRTNSDLNVFQTDAALYWNGTDSNRFQLRANYAHSDRGLPGAVVYYNPYTHQHLWNRDLTLQSNYQQYWKKGFELLLSAKFSHNYLRYLDPDYLNEIRELDQRFTQLEIYGSAALSYHLMKNWEISLASDLAFNKLKTNFYTYSYPTRYTYLNVLATKFKFNKLQLHANILNTAINEKVQVGSPAPSKMIWSPSISASYDLFEDSGIQLRAFYKDIFRNPTFNDLYYTRIGKRNLTPEYTKQYNLGITYSQAYTKVIDYLSLTADIYYNKVKDKIIAIPNKDLFTWTMLNLGEVDIRGIDVSVKTQLPLSRAMKISFTGNYTYQQALNTTDPTSAVYLNQIPYTPKHNLALNIGFQRGDLGLFYNQIISSSRYYLTENLPEYFVPGFSVSDLSIHYQLKLKQLPVGLSAEINNLYNQSYAFIRSFPMPGRSFRFTFQITI